MPASSGVRRGTPGRAELKGILFFFHNLPSSSRGHGCRFLPKPICRIIKSLGAKRCSLEVVQSINHPVFGLPDTSGVLLQKGAPRKPVKLLRSMCFTLTAVQRKEPWASEGLGSSPGY